MLEWERALRLNPEYGAAKKALEATRETMHSKVAAQTWWNQLEPSSWQRHERWVTAIGIWICITGLVLGFTTKNRLAGFLCGGLGALLSLLGVAWAVHTQAEADMALVLERSVVFRAAPANPARALDSLPAGSRLRIMDTSGGWVRAEAADRQIGWLPEASVERISP
jgi:hypothetical protein